MKIEVADFKRVLIVGVNAVTDKLVNVLATQHADIHFDYATSFEIKTNLDNVHILNMDIYCHIIPFTVTEKNSDLVHEIIEQRTALGFFNWLNKYLTLHIEKYDFIIINNLRIQRQEWLDAYRSIRPIFCPNKHCFDLENDKLFTKQILKDAGIPTPASRILDENNLINSIDQIVEQQGFPVVLKTNAAMSDGTGVVIFNDYAYREQLINYTPVIKNTCVKPRNGFKFFVEDYIQGKEFSAHFLCNGSSWKYLGSARDYKREFQDDRGKNTTGTGCYSPVKFLTDEIRSTLFNYIDRLIKQLNSIEISYHGILYLGVIIDVNNNPVILEINSRPGGPEFITILDTIDSSNLLQNLYNAAVGEELHDTNLVDCHSVTVGLINKNYTSQSRFSSNKPDMGELPDDLSFNKTCSVFTNQNIYGFVTAIGANRNTTAVKLHEYLSTIQTNDYRYRTDIGFLE
jgi:phosphoribosylamine--glycine ligase